MTSETQGRVMDQISSPEFINIQSQAHKNLLNVIDELRSQGISRFIELPQIIVCGDQSSGKSSVLEAVSGLKFPTKDALCTRFATELILRRHPNVASTVSIQPDPERPENEKNQLRDFTSDVNIYENLGNIVADATKAMGLDGTVKNFSSDVLRIELSGPEQPHLTLVDLPGLFHAGSKSQSEHDVKAVQALVKGYMKKSRSIVLAVISAKNDLNNQIVSKYVNDLNAGSRTLGVICKPDTLPLGSDSEKQFLELAQNKDVQFKLGWHVLKNRDYSERDSSNAERDAAEKQFFRDTIWSSLPPSQLGVGTLRPRLSQVLQKQILKELPSLLKDVEAGILDCNTRLACLGSARSTPLEQRKHLHKVADSFTKLIHEAVHGRYFSPFFDHPKTHDGYAKRIRAIVNKECEDFAKLMREKGHTYQVVDSLPKSKASPPDDDAEYRPRKIRRQDRVRDVKTLIERNRGKELATIPKEENVTALFREQSSRWKSMAMKQAEDIFAQIKIAVMYALEASCDHVTTEGVLIHIVNPRLAGIKTDFFAAVGHTLYQHTDGHPVTFNHYLSDNLQSLRAATERKRMCQVLKDYFGKDPESAINSTTEAIQVNTKTLLAAMMSSVEVDMTVFACTEALNTMEAYYKVAMKNVVDDFATYAVERALLQRLEGLFPPDLVFELEDPIVRAIAGETEDSKMERSQCDKKLGILEKALDVLKSLDRGSSIRSAPPQYAVDILDDIPQIARREQATKENSAQDNARHATTNLTFSKNDMPAVNPSFGAGQAFQFGTSQTPPESQMFNSPPAYTTTESPFRRNFTSTCSVSTSTSPFGNFRQDLDDIFDKHVPVPCPRDIAELVEWHPELHDVLSTGGYSVDEMLQKKGSNLAGFHRVHWMYHLIQRRDSLLRTYPTQGKRAEIMAHFASKLEAKATKEKHPLAATKK